MDLDSTQITNLTTVHVTPCQFTLYLDALYSASKDPAPQLHSHLFLTEAMNVDGNTQIPFLSLCDVVFGVMTLRHEFDQLTHIFNPTSTATSVAAEDDQPDTNITRLVEMVNQKFCSDDCSHCPGELCVLQDHCSWNINTGCSHTAVLPTKMPTDGPTDSPARSPLIPPIFLGEGYGAGAGHLVFPSAAPEPPPDDTQRDARMTADDMLTAQIVSPGSDNSFSPKVADFSFAALSIAWLGIVIYLIKTRECRSCSSGIGECAGHNNMEPFLPIAHDFHKQREGEVSEVESDIHFEQIEGGRDTHPLEARRQSLEVVLPRHITRGLSDRPILTQAARSTKTSSSFLDSFVGVEHIPQYMSEEAADGNPEYRDLEQNLDQTTDFGAEPSDDFGAEPSDVFETAREHGGSAGSSDEDSIASSNTPSTVIMAKETTPEANRHFYKSARPPMRLHVESSDSERQGSPSVIMLNGPILIPTPAPGPGHVLLDRPRAANRARARHPPPLPVLPPSRPSGSPPRFGPGHELYRPSESPPSTKQCLGNPSEGRSFQFKADDLLLELEKSDLETAPEDNDRGGGLKDSAAERMKFITDLVMDGSSETTDTETSD